MTETFYHTWPSLLLCPYAIKVGKYGLFSLTLNELCTAVQLVKGSTL